LEKPVSEHIHQVLKEADLIKFAGKRANKREMERSLKAVGRIVEQVEEQATHVEA